MKKITLFTAVFLGAVRILSAQEQWSASRIRHEIEKLPVKGTVLYIAAHPDDENTRLISWLANEKKFRTAYLSLTRGDGGQNLIGPELGEKLGIIRTHELMAARKIDGGEQFFTRAFDFGYSKSPEETFTKWNRDSVLSDMVFVIRKLQPDLIITRFPEGGYSTHGHHTASAILASEAFEAAADPKRFPEQFACGVQPWQTKRLYWNASTWWNSDLPEIAASNDSFVSVDVGGYNALLGASYTEIAGRSRSMHKSQGFGSAQPAGEQFEYLKLIRSMDKVTSDNKDPFAFKGNRYTDKEFLNAYDKLIQYTDKEPIKIKLTELVNLYQFFEKQKNSPISAYRKDQVASLLLQVCGIKMHLNAENAEFVQGSDPKVEFSILNRSDQPITFVGLRPQEGLLSLSGLPVGMAELTNNKPYTLSIHLELKEDYYSSLPWLENGITGAMFNNSWRDGGIYPGTDAGPKAEVVLWIGNEEFVFPLALTHMHVDPVKGEIRNAVIVRPQCEIRLSSDKQLLINTDKDSVYLELQANAPYNGPLIIQASGPYSFRKPIRGDLNLHGDSILPVMIPIEAMKANGQGKLMFRMEGTLLQTTRIEYDHIGRIQYCRKPEIMLRQFELTPSPKRIAYLQGAGDEVDHYLRQAGFEVHTLEAASLIPENLLEYQVLILGIRTYNTLDITDKQQEAILEFIRNGGLVLVQYNTSRGLKREAFGPYPFKLGRGRVTDENAPMEAVDPDNPILHFPNDLTESDFEGWVQERGLYFADTFDASYRPIFLSHDPGEDPLSGALIMASYGRGTFIYTGISFFRQLPAGVPGAYRLLGNMIDYQSENP